VSVKVGCGGWDVGGRVSDWIGMSSYRLVGGKVRHLAFSLALVVE